MNLEERNIGRLAAGRRVPWSLATMAAMSLLATGCSDGRPDRVPVSGIVLIDSQPVTYGFIRFYPEQGGRLAQGRIDSEGRFALTTYDRGDGATKGTHRVEILAGEPISDTKTKWHAPKKYADQATSGLTVAIDEAEDDLRIELSWSGGKPFVELAR